MQMNFFDDDDYFPVSRSSAPNADYPKRSESVHLTNNEDEQNDRVITKLRKPRVIVHKRVAKPQTSGGSDDLLSSLKAQTNQDGLRKGRRK